jgi:hypothetical protein
LTWVDVRSASAATAQGTLLKALLTGGEDPRKALQGSPRTDARALNFSKLLCQFPPKAMADKGAREVFVNA